MIHHLLLLSFVSLAFSESCLDCICQVESNCQPLPCKIDTDGTGQLSCGYFQIKQDYYIDCGQPGKNKNESTESAWKRCALNKSCAETCVKNYINRYKGGCKNKSGCEQTARIHNGGPQGCTLPRTDSYWNRVKNCCKCK